MKLHQELHYLPYDNVVGIFVLYLLCQIDADGNANFKNEQQMNNALILLE